MNRILQADEAIGAEGCSRFWRARVLLADARACRLSTRFWVPYSQNWYWQRLDAVRRARLDAIAKPRASLQLGLFA